MWENETFRLMTHPTPKKNFTLLAAPKACGVSRLREITPDDLADVLIKATTAWCKQFDQTPHFNVAIRGGLAGHLHIIMIPRGDTKPRINIEAGFELITAQSIITIDPRDAAQALKQHIRP